jgi:hypothetical protein
MGVIMWSDICFSHFFCFLLTVGTDPDSLFNSNDPRIRIRDSVVQNTAADPDPCKLLRIQNTGSNGFEDMKIRQFSTFEVIFWFRLRSEQDFLGPCQIRRIRNGWKGRIRLRNKPVRPVLRIRIHMFLASRIWIRIH